MFYGTSKNVKVKSDFILTPEKRTFVSKKKITGTISAEFENIKRNVSITAVLPVSVVLPDNYLHLPVEETFKLKTVGGTGVYDYSINSDIASISNLGVLSARAPGETTVMVSDRNNPQNHATLRLKISEIVSIKSLEQNK